MKRPNSQVNDALELLVARGRVISPVADSVRARVLARARELEASGAAAPSSPAFRAVTMPPRRTAMVAAAAVAFVVGAAAAAVALRGRQELPVPAPPAHPAKEVACATPTPLPPPPASVAPAPATTTEVRRAGRAVTAQESYAAELALLQRAQAAYADRSFATALLLVAEHARRFPSGRLAEEREALKVKALSGAGRQKEAARAASAFESRFPRSALLR